MLGNAFVLLTGLFVLAGSMTAGSFFGARFGWTYIDLVWALGALLIAWVCRTIIDRRIATLPPSDDPDIQRLGTSLTACTKQSLFAIATIFVLFALNPKMLGMAIILLGIPILIGDLVVFGWCAHLVLVFTDSLINQTTRLSDRLVLTAAAVNLGMALGYNVFKPPIFLFD